LELDNEDNPHISYYSGVIYDDDGVFYGLRYAHRVNGVWSKETVDKNSTYCGEDSSLELDANGYPHISYYCALSVTYAWYDGSVWHIEALDLPRFSNYPSLQLDINGYPHISCHVLRDIDGQSYNHQEYTWYDGDSWNVDLIEEGHWRSSLVLDESGSPHVVYVSGEGLRYAHFSGAFWEFTTIVEGIDAFSINGQMSLALDLNGFPHVFYLSREHNQLEHLRFDGSTWQKNTVDTFYNLGTGGTSIALYNNQSPQAVYSSDMGLTELRYARRLYDGWVSESLDTGIAVEGVSLSINELNQPHVSYSANGYLKYAKYDYNNWQIENVDDVAYNILKTSLALDSLGQPHIAYNTRTENVEKFRYAKKEGTTWNVEIIDGEHYISDTSQVSLILDNNDNPHVFYTSYYSETINHAWYDGVSWNIVTIDSAYGGIAEIDAVVDKYGQIHIYYRHETMKYARFDGNTWNIEPLDVYLKVDGITLPPYSRGTFGTLALDSSGQPHIAFTYSSLYTINKKPFNSNIVHIWKEGSTWNGEVVTSIPRLYHYRYISMEIDDENHPHIVSWLDGANDMLYASRNGGITPPPEPIEDISILHIEVTQVIQDELNNIPLIKNKPTFVRVYVDCGAGCSSYPDVSGTLEVSSSMGSGTLNPNTGTITAYHPTSWIDQRNDLKKTLNFYTIPVEILSGEVTFTAKVGSSTMTVVKNFNPGKKLTIAWVPIIYQPNAPELPRYRPDPHYTYRAWGYMDKIYPVGIFDLIYYLQPQLPSEQLTVSVPFSKYYAWTEYLPKLNRLWTIIESQNAWYIGKPNRLFGWAPWNAYDLEDGIGGAADAAYTSIYGRTGSGRVAAGLDTKEYQWTLAHEIAHLHNDLGLIHAPCGLPEGEAGELNIPGGFIGDWGIDFLSGTTPKLLSPNKVYDFMSYCHPDWISKYHFNKLSSGFKDYSFINTIANLSTDEEITPIISVYGTVIKSPIQVEFGALYPLDSFVQPDESRGTDYCLELRDGNEVTLDSRCFDLSFVLPETGDPMDRETFTFALPYPINTHSLVLSHLGTEIGRVTRSNNIPTIQLISPNGGEVWESEGSYTVSWIADDADDDPLSYIVSYSIDDGITWLPMAVDVTTTSLEVDSQHLPGSTFARFKITASDNMNSSSDSSDAQFTVLGKDPQVFILIPEQDITVPPGIPIFLQGYAYDLEDGVLNSDSLQWISNLDGYLGAGSTLFVALSHGQHMVTLTATDSNGNVASHVVNIYIGYKLHHPIIMR
jgi:hypothetical protein